MQFSRKPCILKKYTIKRQSVCIIVLFFIDPPIKRVNWKENQPVRNTYKFNKRERERYLVKLNSTISMSSSQLATVFIASEVLLSAFFGNEKDDSFKSSIGQIYQTFGGEELYPSVEEKAAMLLYLVTKNHSFSDGNKRIAATLFLWFLNNNHILYREDGSKRIADNTLVALTLMIAESRTEEKDVMVKVVVNLINQRNE